MRRQPAIGRVASTCRKLAFGRRPIGFIDDGKLHAVLDTNIIIYALEARYKGQNAEQIENNCLVIIQEFEKGTITIGLNAKLFAEYRDVSARKVSEGKIHSQDMSDLITLIEKKAVAVRMLINPQKLSPHPSDDILFDGLSTSYLISNNLKHVDPSKLLQPSSYDETLTPLNFLKVLSNKGII